MRLKFLFGRTTEYFQFKGKALPVWNWGYRFIQPPLIIIPFKFYYRKFDIAGWEHMPTDKPVLLAISHRNAFMDSLALVNTHYTQVWQLARGDAFNNPVLRRLFYFFHMLPIWRERDGAGADTKAENQSTYEACYDILKLNGMVGIYPEGDCINERHIRSLKKGICRIAFGAMEQFNWDLDLHIVPVGISYSHAPGFRETQLIQFGKPILAADYKHQWDLNQGNAINLLKEDIEASMKKLVVDIPKGHYHHDIDELAVMMSHRRCGKNGSPLEILNEQRATVARLQQTISEHPEQMTELVRALHPYKRKTRELQLDEETLDEGKQRKATRWSVALALCLTLPLFLMGWITHALPVWLTRTAVKKVVKKDIFISSIRYAVGMLSLYLYYIILLLLGILLLPVAWWAIAGVLALPFLGVFAWEYQRRIRLFARVQKVRRLLRLRDTGIMEIYAHREKIYRLLS